MWQKIDRFFKMFEPLSKFQPGKQGIVSHGGIFCKRWEVSYPFPMNRLSVWADEKTRVLFPGALNSEFTNTMDFLRPSTSKAISTYRVMDQYGQVLDKEVGVDIEDEKALELYKNMVCC